MKLGWSSYLNCDKSSPGIRSRIFCHYFAVRTVIHGQNSHLLRSAIII